MSYCRFSSMDFKCDLYVYESDEGVSVNVATSRVVGDVPSINWADTETVYRTYKAQMEFMKTAQRKTIGGAYDGMSWYGLSHLEAAGLVSVLQDSGYIFPEDLIEDLLEDRDE